MDYDPVSFLHWICGVTEVVGGHPLKNRRRSGFGIHVGWPLYQSPGRHNGQLSISAGSGAISYFGADFNLGQNILRPIQTFWSTIMAGPLFVISANSIAKR